MNQTTSWKPTTVALGLTLLCCGVLGPAAAASDQEEPEGHRGFMAANGRVTYRVYCSNCHGAAAEGDGNLAQYLNVEPSDLTVLTAENEGRFPRELLIEVIDGRRAVRGHGGKEMPVWGDVFQHSLSEEVPADDESGEERARRKILELVLYLETIQTENPAKVEPEGGR